MAGARLKKFNNAGYGNKMTCVPIEDSNQPELSPMIRVFTVYLALSYPLRQSKCYDKAWQVSSWTKSSLGVNANLFICYIIAHLSVSMKG